MRPIIAIPNIIPRNKPVIKKDEKTSMLTNEQRKHFEESIRHNHELLKRLAQL